MIHIYAGFDQREEAGYHAFTSSLLEHASAPFTVTPLHLPLFRSFYAPGVRDGSNAFVYTRFLIPFLQGYTGSAIFCDGADMLMKADIAELWALRDPYKPVQVVKHDYRTRWPRKYLGTKMEAPNEDYPRKQWSSVMIMNCMHMSWRQITPESVQQMTGAQLHQFSWLADDQIGELPKAWNWLVQEDGANPEAKLLHFSAGIPLIPMHADVAHADDYWHQAARMNHVTD
ncbi:MAG: glycosyltransferase [Betaproteobacteria bacterium]|nr:glycosyltransferase [Betaproteobacteria bacterium]